MTATANSEELYRRQRTNVTWDGDVMCLDYRGVMILDPSEVVKLSKLLHPQRVKNVRINLRNVLSLPSGYFGQIYYAASCGIQIRFVDAAPEIQSMQWYRQFVNEDEEFTLCPNCTTAAE